MTSMQLKLEDGLKKRLEHRAAESGFKSVEEYAKAILQADAADDQLIDDDVEQMLLRRLDDDDPGIGLTLEFIREFKQQVRKRREKRNGKRQ